MRTIEQIFGKKKIVPTVIMEDATIAEPLAEAFLEAGINVLAMRIMHPKSLDIINKLLARYKELTIGVGGILNAADFLNASLAGAEFISSPGTTPELFQAARTRYNDAHFIPGVITPSNVMQALGAGFDVMNVFPVEALNGYELIQSYAHTFPRVKFGVNGGTNIENIEKYLRLENVIAVGISCLATAELIANRDFNEVKRRTREVINLASRVADGDASPVLIL